jgi:transposase
MNRCFLALLFLAGVSLGAGGCSDWEKVFHLGAEQTGQKDFFAREPKADDILIYFQYIQGLPPRDLVKEYDRAWTDFESNKNDFDRFRLVCLSILPEESFTDRVYALKLLQDYSSNLIEKDGLGGLAKLLNLLISEQQGIQGQLCEEQEHARTLARQLKELKDIEKILSEREKSDPTEK